MTDKVKYINDCSQATHLQQVEIDDQRSLLHTKTSEISNLRVLLEEEDTPQSYIRRSPVDLSRRFVPRSHHELDDAAFFVRLDATEVTGINMNQQIMFDKVVLNLGNFFDITTGEFTAPVDGLFLLSVTVASDFGHNHQLQVALMKNGVILARAHAHGDSRHLDQGGITIVTQLAASDRVYIKSLSPDGSALYGVGLTSFSGYHIMFK